MTPKDKALPMVQSLPDDASFEDAMEHLMMLLKTETGIQQADAGRTLSHDPAKGRLSKRLK